MRFQGPEGELLTQINTTSIVTTGGCGFSKYTSARFVVGAPRSTITAWLQGIETTIPSGSPTGGGGEIISGVAVGVEVGRGVEDAVEVFVTVGVMLGVSVTEGLEVIVAVGVAVAVFWAVAVRVGVDV